MEFNYDLKEHCFKRFNEAQGVYIDSKKLIKGKQTSASTFLGFSLKLLLFGVTLFIIGILLYIVTKNELLLKIFGLGVGITGGLLIFFYISFFIYYFYFKNKSTKGSIKINEEGILDKNKNGLEVGFSWDLILIGVITEHTITIITKKPIIIILDTKIEKDIKKIFKQYKKEIIDVRKDKEK